MERADYHPKMICWPFGVVRRGESPHGVWDVAEDTPAGYFTHGEAFAERSSAVRAALGCAKQLRPFLTKEARMRQYCPCGGCGFNREAWGCQATAGGA